LGSAGSVTEGCVGFPRIAQLEANKTANRVGRFQDIVEINVLSRYIVIHHTEMFSLTQMLNNTSMTAIQFLFLDESVNHRSIGKLEHKGH